jgi:hypothetical protein
MITPSFGLCDVITTALPAAVGMRVVAVLGTVGFDADFAVEEPHAARASVATARIPRRMRQRRRSNPEDGTERRQT